MTRERANEIIMKAAENSAKAMMRPDLVREARKETLRLSDHEALTLAKGIKLGLI